MRELSLFNLLNDEYLPASYILTAMIHLRLKTIVCRYRNIPIATSLVITLHSSDCSKCSSRKLSINYIFHAPINSVYTNRSLAALTATLVHSPSEYTRLSQIQPSHSFLFNFLLCLHFTGLFKPLHWVTISYTWLPPNAAPTNSKFGRHNFPFDVAAPTIFCILFTIHTKFTLLDCSW